MLKLICALIIVSLWASFAFSGPAKYSRSRHFDAAEYKIARQLLIRIKAEGDEPALKAALPEGTTIIARQGTTYVVRLPRPVEESDVEDLESRDFVSYVERDTPAYPHKKDPCDEPTSSKPMEEPKDIGRVARATRGRCALSETCPKSNRAKLWAQERVQADLANEEPVVKALKRSHTKVAVIDTGFDSTANQGQIANPDFNTNKGYDGAGEPGKDEGGHGTMVVGVIAAKDGVGIAPTAQVTSYRVAEPRYTGGSVSHATLKIAIERACKAGNEIINVSWGSSWDEDGIERDEETDKDFLKQLADHGCLVVKSAGNGGSRQNFKSNNPDDAYLRVAATAPDGSMAQFSSVGEISAPGAGVFTLESHDVYSEEKAKSDNLCGKARGRFVDGTSFASPITGAVAALVTGVLKQTRTFPTLSGPERIRLVNRILISSQFGGTVNALRAVAIAERWGWVMDLNIAKKFQREVMLRIVSDLHANWRQNAPSTADLQNLLGLLPHDVCSAPAKSCAPIVGCTDQQACVRDGRKIAALCLPPDKTVVKDLLETELANDNLESATAWLRQTKDLYVSTEEQGRYAAQLWKKYRERWTHGEFKYKEINLSSNLNFDVALQILPSYIETRAENKDGKAEIIGALNDFLASNDVNARLEGETKSSAPADLAMLMELLKKAHKKLDAKQMSQVFAQYFKNINEVSSLTAARLMGLLLSESAFNDLKPALLEQDAKLYKFIIDSDTPLTPTHLNELSPFFKRNFSHVEPLLDKALESGDLSKLGGAEVHFLLSDTSPLKSDKKEKLGMLALGAIAKNRGWLYLDSPIAERAFEVLKRSASRATYETALEPLVISSNNLELLAAVIPFTNANWLTDGRLKDIAKKSLFSTKFLFKLARQVALSYPVQSKKAIENSMVSVESLLSQAMPFLVSDPEQGAGSEKTVRVSLFPETNGGRKSRQLNIQTKDVAAKSVPDALDSLLAFMIDDYRDVNAKAVSDDDLNWRKEKDYNLIELIIKNPKAMGLLPKNGTWKSAYRRLIDDAKTNKNYSKLELDDMDKILSK